jgi:hypothetical protein
VLNFSQALRQDLCVQGSNAVWYDKQVSEERSTPIFRVKEKAARKIEIGTKRKK